MSLYAQPMVLLKPISWSQMTRISDSSGTMDLVLTSVLHLENQQSCWRVSRAGREPIGRVLCSSIIQSQGFRSRNGKKSQNPYRFQQVESQEVTNLERGGKPGKQSTRHTCLHGSCVVTGSAPADTHPSLRFNLDMGSRSPWITLVCLEALKLQPSASYTVLVTYFDLTTFPASHLMW